MIPVAIIFAATVAQASATAPQTSVFARCKVASTGEMATHDLDVVFFDPPVSWAQSLNFRDPDHLVPKASPLIANGWPTGLLVSFRSAEGAKAGTMLLTASLSDPASAQARLDLAADETRPATRVYTGNCAYTQGPVAESEFRKLLNK